MASMIRSLFPDPAVLLALAPEELARYLLKIVSENQQQGKFHPQNFSTSLTGVTTSYTVESVYPQQLMPEVELAIWEAWQWLVVNLIVVPDDGINGSNGWVRLSRRGAKLSDDSKFADFRKAATFPKSLLHKSIVDQVWLDLARGELEDAVFHAFRAVEIAVRDACGYPSTEYGVPMMRNAFHPDKGPLRDPAQDPSEREALSAMFAGAIGSYKNPHSHRTATIQETLEAQEMAMLASHLLRIVDDRRARFRP
jgi:uncharacterized protein (TIGR02391 family)